jgi:hypothetical protein
MERCASRCGRQIPPKNSKGPQCSLSRLTVVFASLALAGGATTAAAAASAPEAKKPPAKAKCHPSYKGACLDPYASDYDCAGGSGNGPKYTGAVRVVGPDVFRLDSDGDGWGCE